MVKGTLQKEVLGFGFGRIIDEAGLESIEVEQLGTQCIHLGTSTRWVREPAKN